MGTKKKRKGKSRLKRPQTDATDLLTLKLTEMRNAERLLELYEQELRYVGPWEMWLTWDGRRWKPDEDDAAMRFAKTNAQVMAAEADATLKHAQEVHDDEVESDAADKKAAKKKPGRPAKPKASPETIGRLKAASAYKKWCENSQNNRNLRATLEIASSDKAVSIVHAQLDTHHFLFNVENCTIDLKTGKDQPHARADLITKIAPIKFDPKAKCRRWEEFVNEAMGGDKELVAYNQRFAGYSLTGSTDEHALVFFYGEGNNGKSTYLTTLYKMFGDYALRAARGLLFRSKHGNERHPTTLASLHGKRFVTCAEIGENQELDEELTKDLTGGDPINARRMREDEWNFLPTHKLFLAGNHKPRITGTDKGIWRRNNLVPWNVAVAAEKLDKQLGEKLLKEASGILNWCIEGCLEWQKRGLDPPESVVAATAEYRKEQDVLGQFFEERLVFDATDRVARTDLREAYEAWCKELGHMPVGARKLAQALRSKSVMDGSVWDPKRGQSLDGWTGVRLATKRDRAERELKKRGDQMSKRERKALRAIARGKKPRTSKASSGLKLVFSSPEESQK